MAKRRRSKSKRRPLDPVEVAEGHLHVRAEDLFDLVHEVNPTGLRLAAKEQTRRYELKSRLQSLLVLRFGDEWIDVTATDDAGVVSLNHRSGRRNACHAVLSELEPEARSWILRQLDLAASPEPEARFDDARSDGGRTHARAVQGSHLERGRRALDAYDYERAEHHLRLAVDAERGFEAARCLLELWVDVLGMDAQALELELRLSQSAREHPGVRTLLALAAARLGERERALALVEGLSASRKGTSRARTAEVHAALAAAALREDDHEEATRAIAVLGELDPTHPKVPHLLDEVAKLRAADLRVVEQDLERRYREAGCDGSEPEARAVLERWPESEVARRILRERAEQRRQADLAGHLERAAAAFDEERFDDAARHYEAAVAAGCDTEEVSRRLEASRRRGRRQREQSRLDEIVRLFEGHETREALVRYLGLPENLKRRLKQRTHPPSLDWLDAMDAPPSGARAHAAAAAAVSLETARRRLARGDARAALDEVAPHLELLEGLGEGRRVSEEAREQLDARRREHARGVLASALEAFRGGHTSRAGELLGSVHLEDLDNEDRGKAEHLLADVEKANTRQQLEQEYERFLASENWMGALDRSRRRARLESDGEEQHRWRERGARLRRRIRETWRVERDDGAVALAEAQGIFLDARARPPAVLLDEEGRHLALVNAWDNWLFLRIVDLGSLEVVRRWSLRTPQPLESPVRIAWNGESIQVCGKRGGFVDVSPRTGDVLDWRPIESLATVSEDRVFPQIDGPFTCWPNPVSGPVEEYYMGVLVRTMNRGVTEIRRQFTELLPSVHHGVGHQVYMCRTMRLLDFAPDQRESYVRELARKYPRHTGVLMLRAEPEADAGRWDEALRILANVEIDLESDQKNFLIVHFYHLIGLALLHNGLIEEAGKAFRNGRSQDFWGECVLSPLVELTTPMAEGSEEQESQPHRPLVRQLVARIRLAGRALAAEDFTAAREVLERPVVWREVEVQTAARLAEAWLGLDAETPGQRFRKRLALAFFCHATHLEPGSRREIVLPGTMWLPERLRELESRARAWLES